MVQMYKALKTNNVSNIVGSLASQNPMFSDTLKLVNDKYGGDGKAAFYTAAKEQGLNDNQIQQFLANVQSLLT